ncbi:NAD-dependent epimerase/dehydratase family protein [bacterium M00.F.Ca.ET.228.01.1.1]|uniref:NmrA family NAD(P)-binding protein n=2 Tax=Paraburkholderia phenoliruptrix TaxID=252970 RepID=UPI001092D241|nr:NmrA family NAD(P)-binding protein [Paraburkholderia phenoliruptrix]MBW9095821.1 NmrA family NAD(P)-binding protein [Paraburkholderia phenoliruptrix]TGP39727.1 NAD-dependent epimerase/dehydratase family protein [bacterium M00.F.Ca.ET.228.01.1.1]TGR95568.1 NAD-dependent epimerase/dehydratase family protein [bacterium M00.F.Ca.ET.191.01.1.1]TGT96556.1 NAD-dependent epimerase/dehydratase family protein [bacterium M00.F.Ca.ET.155.01.1.1]
MYAITGVTGRVGGAAARALLAGGHKVRAVLRDETKAAQWRECGAEVVIASFEDTTALTAAFSGMTGVFVMMAPNFAPQPGYPNAHAAAQVLKKALSDARPQRVAVLSSVGGQRESGLGLITQVHILEEALAGLPDLQISTAIMRPAWFMENSLWDIAPARGTGVMPAFLQPLDRAYPMVATEDIGRVVARTLTQSWQGRRVIEIEGPQRYTQHDIAALLGSALQREVQARTVPRDQWEALFQSQGTAWPAPRMEMLDGFNSGWIDFEGGANEHVTGQTTFQTVLAELVKRAG